MAFISIDCFSNRTKFKVKTHSGREFVVHTDDLRSVVLDHPLCMGLDMNTVVSKLEDLNITDKATRREHMRILQTAHAKGNWTSAESLRRYAKERTNFLDMAFDVPFKRFAL